MKYLTDIHALNLPCKLGTTGDWHASAIQWQNLRMMESDTSPFGDYGIEVNSLVHVPEHENSQFNIANHVRACLDMIEQNRFSVAQGMRKDFLDDDEKYDNDVFRLVFLLKDRDNWEDIDRFMKKEYLLKWTKYKETQ